MLRPPLGDAASAELADKLGGGAEGGVYSLQNVPGLAAKVYPDKNRTTQRRARIEAMIAAPPSPIMLLLDRIHEPLLAWPTQLLTEDDGRFAGFVMARVPKSFVALNHMLRGSRRGGGDVLDDDDRSLPSRLAGARNLARLVQSVHDRGHLVIDLNAPNIRVQRKTMVVCLLDCDSFAIARNGHIEFAPTAMREEGLAPEFQGRSLQTLRFDSDAQDRFALAVLVFQWLNRGIHPFQGVLDAPHDPDSTEQHSLQYFIQRGCYAYGLTAHAEVRPMATSDHDTFPPSLRQMFDRAFASADPRDRPTAEEWARELRTLKAAQHLQRCARMPDNVLHIHFQGAACPQCRFERLLAAGSSVEATSPGPVSASVSQASGTSTASGSGAPAQVSAPAEAAPPAPAPATTAPQRKQARKLALLAVATAVALAAYLVFFGDRRPSYETGSAASPPPATAPTATPGPDEQSVAQKMASADDEAGLRARSTLLQSALEGAERDNLSDLLQWTRQVVGMPLAEVEQRAKTRDVSQTHAQALLSWTRFRPAARETHARALTASAAQDDRTAAALARNALALDPQDLEVAGNLAEFEARAGDRPAALTALSYAMALRARNTGRSADWQLFGNLQAIEGNADVAEGAYTVALAITPRPDGLCTNIRSAIARWGPNLRIPLTKIAARFGELPAGNSTCSLD